MQSREQTRDEQQGTQQALPGSDAASATNGVGANPTGPWSEPNAHRDPSAFVVAVESSQTEGNAAPLRDKQQPAGGQANKWAVFAVIAIGVFMATLDSSIVNISLPAIGAYFNVPLNGSVEWVIISYLVVIAATLLTIGRLADMIGRKYIWLTGLIIFTLGSALSGASPSLELLIAARAFQGLGGALIMAISPAMLTGAFPTSERGRALGLNALTVALGVSAGPTLGGIITESLTWRWIFYVNVPIGILGVIFTLRVLKERLQRNKGQFDPLGAVLLGVGLASLTLGLSFGQEWGWTSPRLIIALIVGVVPLVALVFVERWVKSPIVRFELLKDRVFASANLSLVLSFLALFAVSFMLPFYLEQLRDFSIIESGLLLTPLPLTIAALAPLSGALADRIGTRWLAAGGLAIACIGLVLISQLNAQSSLFDIIWRLAFTGVGQALFQSPNNSALMGAAPRGQQGVASGFLATGRVVGQSLSVALAGAVFASLGGSAAGIALTIKRQGAHVLAPVATLESQFAHAFQVTFLVCAAICAIGIAASLVRGKS
ncbi:MAG: DHA2 family efflux MFS transporter permease subunit [Ktedonobacterales bacterium]